MAQIIEVKVNYGRTINLGNYESSRIDVELSAKILDGENSQETIEDLRQMCKLKVQQFIDLEQKTRAEEYSSVTVTSNKLAV